MASRKLRARPKRMVARPKTTTELQEDRALAADLLDLRDHQRGGNGADRLGCRKPAVLHRPYIADITRHDGHERVGR